MEERIEKNWKGFGRNQSEATHKGYFLSTATRKQFLVVHNHNRKPLAPLSFIFLGMTKHKTILQQVKQLVNLQLC